MQFLIEENKAALLKEQASVEAVKLLTSNGAASLANIYGRLPLHYACISGASVRVMQFLIEENEDALLA